MEDYVLIYLGSWLLMSLITFMVYKIDKNRAIKNKWRIKEVTLLTLSFLLGSIGGLFALYGLRHKNKHWYFVVTNVFAFILHLGILIYLVYPILIK